MRTLYQPWSLCRRHIHASLPSPFITLSWLKRRILNGFKGTIPCQCFADLSLTESFIVRRENMPLFASRAHKSDLATKRSCALYWKKEYFPTSGWETSNTTRPDDNRLTPQMYRWIVPDLQLQVWSCYWSHDFGKAKKPFSTQIVRHIEANVLSLDGVGPYDRIASRLVIQLPRIYAALHNIWQFYATISYFWWK